MPRPMKSRLFSIALLALAGFAVFIGAAMLYDRLSRPHMDFEPNDQPSALDDADIQWPERILESSPELETDPQGTVSTEGTVSSADLVIASCGSLSDDRLPERWMVIGWDGADWQLILPLLQEGKLPNLERLMRGGSYGTLASIVPTISPAIWTTVATGTTPGEHGILHFYNQQPLLARWWNRLRHLGELERRLYTNADRQRHAIWNLATEHDRDVLVVGYHNTFPVEQVKGLMVSNYLVQDSVAQTMHMEAGDEENDLASSLVYPLEHLGRVLDIQKETNSRIPEIVQRFADIPDEELTEFLRDSRRIDPERDQKPYFLVHAWLFDQIVAEVADAFLGETSPDLAMVHFQGVDWAAHRFLYYHSPELYADMDWSEETRARLDAEKARYQDTVSAFYVYLDEWLGRLLTHRDDRTGVLLMSDHGFAAEADPDINGGHDHAPPGMIVLNGPGIRRDHKLTGADIYDVLPTLVTGLGLPLAKDLKGDPLVDAFCPDALAAASTETVDTYSSGERFIPEISRPADLDRELLQQMKSLGYIQ